MVRKAPERRLAEFGSLFMFVECQELAVGLDGRIGRRLAAKSFEARRGLKLLGLFVNIGLQHIVPRARRALAIIPSTTRLAACGLIALLIAVFPANIYMYQHPELFAVSPLVLLLRLPFQGILILWAWVYTRKQSATAKRIAPGDGNDLQ